MNSITRWWHNRTIDRRSNLVAHAKRELALIDDGDDMQRRMNAHMLNMVREFAREGHSGSSAAYSIGCLSKLLRFEPLTPLTGEPDEWNQVGDDVWQNRRCGRVFSDTGTPNGPAHDIEGRVFEDEHGAYTNGDSSTPVTFPYVPITERVRVSS